MNTTASSSSATARMQNQLALVVIHACAWPKTSWATSGRPMANSTRASSRIEENRNTGGFTVFFTTESPGWHIAGWLAGVRVCRPRKPAVAVVRPRGTQNEAACPVRGAEPTRIQDDPAQKGKVLQKRHTGQPRLP